LGIAVDPEKKVLQENNLTTYFLGEGFQSFLICPIDQGLFLSLSVQEMQVHEFTDIERTANATLVDFCLVISIKRGWCLLIPL